MYHILRWSWGRRLNRNFCSATSLYFIELQKKWRLTVVCCVSIIFVFILQGSILTVKLHKQIWYFSWRSRRIQLCLTTSTLVLNISWWTLSDKRIGLLNPKKKRKIFSSSNLINHGLFERTKARDQGPGVLLPKDARQVRDESCVRAARAMRAVRVSEYQSYDLPPLQVTSGLRLCGRADLQVCWSGRQETRHTRHADRELSQVWHSVQCAALSALSL